MKKYIIILISFIALKTHAQEPKIASLIVEKPMIYLGDAHIGDTIQLSIDLANVGDTTAYIESVTPSESHIQIKSYPESISNNQSESLSIIIITDDLSGYYTEYIKINSEATLHPLELIISANFITKLY